MPSHNNRKLGRGPSPNRAPAPFTSPPPSPPPTPPHTHAPSHPPLPLPATPLSPHTSAHTHQPHHAPPPAELLPIRRSTRARAATRPRPQPAADAIILYTVGRDIPQRDRHELQTLLDTFHANRYLQDQCRLILDNSLEFLVPEHVDGLGAGYKACKDIPAGTRLTVYSGKVSRFGADPGNHFLSLDDVGLGYPLTIDGTPSAGSEPASVPVGQMQLLNHACPPLANCQSDELVCDDTGLPLCFVFTIRPIAAGSAVCFSYQRRVTSTSFWRHESMLARPPRGYETVRCGCARPQRCPNHYARHERRTSAPLPAPMPTPPHPLPSSPPSPPHHPRPTSPTSSAMSHPTTHPTTPVAPPAARTPPRLTPQPDPPHPAPEPNPPPSHPSPSPPQSTTQHTAHSRRAPPPPPRHSHRPPHCHHHPTHTQHTQTHHSSPST
jgi:hypothetical protein